MFALLVTILTLLYSETWSLNSGTTTTEEDDAAGTVVAIGADIVAVGTSGGVLIFDVHGTRQNDGTLVISAPFEELDYYGGGGLAYIFENTGKQTTAEDPFDESRDPPATIFGTAVAMGGDIVAVGTNEGDVLIFDVHGTRLGNVEKNAIEGHSSVDEFLDFKDQGSIKDQKAIAVDGTRRLIVAGAPMGNSEHPSGLVYVFGATGEEVARLSANEASVNTAFFGSAVSVDEGIIVVGSPGDGPGGAYIFNAEGVQVKKLAPPQQDSDSRQYFGYSVDVDQAHDTIVVGAPGADVAYIFDTTGGQKGEHELEPKVTSANGNWFGHSVAAANGVIAVGAPKEDNWRGSVYLFDTAGKHQDKFASVDPEASYSGFGWLVEIGSAPPTPPDHNEQLPGNGFVAVSNREKAIEVQTFSKSR